MTTEIDGNIFASAFRQILIESFLPEIDRVIFNGPATIVFWADGTKTVVKCKEDEVFDEEKGLAMAVCKKLYGNTGRYMRIFRKHIKEDISNGRF